MERIITVVLSMVFTTTMAVAQVTEKAKPSAGAAALQTLNVHSMDLIPAPPPGPPSFPVVLTDIQMNRAFEVVQRDSPFTVGLWWYWPDGIITGSAQITDADLNNTAAAWQAVNIYAVSGDWIKTYPNYNVWVNTATLPGSWYKP